MKKDIVYGFIWKFGERITAQLVSLIVSIVIARKLVPEDYGIVTFVMIFISIANVFVSSGLGNALIQKKDATDIDFSTVFYINILLGIVIYLVIFASSPSLARVFKMPILSPALRVLGIRVVIASINSVQQAYVSRNMLFKCFFWSTLFGTIVSGFVGVFLAYKNFGVWALIIQYLTNALIDTIVLRITIKWRPRMLFSFSAAKNLFSYGWKILVSSLIDTAYKQSRTFIIGGKYTSADLAFYDQGNKYPSFVVTNINTSIGSVIFPALSKHQNDPQKITEITRQVIRISSFFLWPCMIGFAAVAKQFVSVVLTDKWLPCVPYIQLFCVSYGFWPIHTANLQAINAMGRSDIFLKLEIIKKIIGVITIIFCVRISPMALAISAVGVDIISIFINAFPNRKLLQYGYLEQLKDIFPSMLSSLLMSLIIFPISFLPISDIKVLALKIILGCFSYVFLSLVFKNKALVYLIGSMKNNKN